MSALLERTVIHRDAASLADAAAGALLRRLESIQREGRRPWVALTGGTIAGQLYERIAVINGSTDAPEVDWSQVSIWWGDERYVEANDPDRNEQQARSAFLDAVGATDVHPMPSRKAGLSAGAAAGQYGREMSDADWHGFDLVLLGLGPDGHIASLFPGRRSVDEVEEDVVAEMSSPKPPAARITLTRPALNTARSVWFIVSGEEKAPAVREARARGPLTECPARGVRGERETVWFLDSGAAQRSQ